MEPITIPHCSSTKLKIEPLTIVQVVIRFPQGFFCLRYEIISFQEMAALPDTAVRQPRRGEDPSRRVGAEAALLRRGLQPLLEPRDLLHPRLPQGRTLKEGAPIGLAQVSPEYWHESAFLIPFPYEEHCCRFMMMIDRLYSVV